ncbi:hypothetical protein ADUPG1_002240, partial [Aduncisulcus paluster]
QAKIGAKHPRSVKMLNTQIKTSSEPLKFSVYSGNDFIAKQYIILKTQILRGEKKPKAMHGCFGMIKYWIVDWMPEGIPLLIGREDLARMGITLNVHSFRPSGDPVSEVKQVFKSLFVNTGVESPLISDPKEQNQWKKDREYRRAKLRYIDSGYEDRRGLTDEQTEGIDREQRIRAENRRANGKAWETVTETRAKDRADRIRQNRLADGQDLKEFTVERKSDTYAFEGEEFECARMTPNELQEIFGYKEIETLLKTMGPEVAAQVNKVAEILGGLSKRD